MKQDSQILKKISAHAFNMRKNILKMGLSAGAGSSHLGGGLSMVDITATLFGAILKLDPQNPEWSDRDRFILSKGHGVLGYYTALHEAGFINEEDLLNFEKHGSELLGHPIMNRKKGIEFSTGSLGMGLSLGIGVALAARRRKSSSKVYVLMGDGECNEGSVWEAAIAAAHFKLNNLVAIVDRNHFQQTGANADIMSVGDLASKWASFGWDARELNGHNIEELYETFSGERNSDKPLAIVAQTTKGKGISFMENNNDWHHSPLTTSQYEMALKEISVVRESLG